MDLIKFNGTNEKLFSRYVVEGVTPKTTLIVPETHNALVILNGEMLQTLSKGRYKLSQIVDIGKGEESSLEIIFVSKTAKLKLLWGTANVFSHPRYMNGAATNPDFGAVAYAGTQIKNAIDATIALGGENYVFWGGRRVHVPAEYRYEAGERSSGDDVDDGAGLRPSQRIQRNFPRRAQTYGTHQTSV